MPDADEAAKKIAAATLELKPVREAHANGEQVKGAERRLYLLLRLFVGFKDDPDFKATYHRETTALRKSV